MCNPRKGEINHGRQMKFGAEESYKAGEMKTLNLPVSISKENFGRRE